jgi:hypothetical protein
VIGGSDLDLLFQLMKEELLAFEATVFKRFEAPPGSAGTVMLGRNGDASKSTLRSLTRCSFFMRISLDRHAASCD